MTRFLLIALLLLPLPAMAAPKYFIQYQDQFGKWRPYQTKHNEEDAWRVAKQIAKRMGKRFRLTDEGGRVLDLIDP